MTTIEKLNRYRQHLLEFHRPGRKKNPLQLTELTPDHFGLTQLPEHLLARQVRQEVMQSLKEKKP